MRQYKDFQEFWPFYLGEHARKGTRALHFLGTSLLFVFLIRALLTQSVVNVAWGVFSAYGFAWMSHFFIEKNKPATFRYPLLSLMGDFKMFALMMTGKINNEIERLKIRPA